MSIEAIFLYGSWARGDQSDRSDNDLLMVTNETRGYHVTDGHYSMTYYPLPTLKQKAVIGDLFVYHIVLEAKSVFDPNNVLGLLRGLFKPKSSYDAEIGHGRDLGWYLVDHYLSYDEGLRAKRIAWCVRTILIARSVMAGHPVFAPDKLRSFSNFDETSMLIAARYGNFAEELISVLENFLRFENLARPLEASASEDAWRRRFIDTGNFVGIQLIKSQSDRHQSTPYG